MKQRSIHAHTHYRTQIMHGHTTHLDDEKACMQVFTYFEHTHTRHNPLLHHVYFLREKNCTQRSKHDEWKGAKCVMTRRSPQGTTQSPTDAADHTLGVVSHSSCLLRMIFKHPNERKWTVRVTCTYTLCSRGRDDGQ